MVYSVQVSITVQVDNPNKPPFLSTQSIVIVGGYAILDQIDSESTALTATLCS
jgi:hypothetical protein